MRSSRFIALGLLLVFSPAVCRASLGDSEAQCVAKYGNEFDVQANLGFDVIGDKAAFFNLKTPRGAFLLKVTFLNGVASFERVTNADSSREISEDQKRGLLQMESSGLDWNREATVYRTDRSDTTYGSETWLRSDGATAVCWMSGKPKLEHGWGEIDLSTRQYAAAQRTLDRQDGAR